MASFEKKVLKGTEKKTSQKQEESIGAILDAINAKVSAKVAPQSRGKRKPSTKKTPKIQGVKIKEAKIKAQPRRKTKAKKPTKAAGANKLSPTTQITMGSGAGQSLEDMTLRVLRPLLYDWLKVHLPTLVRSVVADELKMIIKKGKDKVS